MNLGSYSNPSQNSNYHSRSRRQQLQHRPRQQLQLSGSDKALLLSVECWENIFRYLTPNYNDLHSCLLVNRFFCKIVVPILWESPFSQYIKDKNNNNTQSKDLSNKCYHKLIRTILSGLSPIKKNYLIYNGINSIRHLPASTTFNYVSLIKSVILDQWTLDFHYNPTDFGYYVFTALSEASANNLTKLSIKDIFNVKQLESLKNLISSQNNLKYLRLELTEKLSQIESGGILSDYYCQLFSILKSQKKSLTCLKLVNLNFRTITSDSISSLSECDNIRTLHLINCKNISSSRFFSLVFRNLKELKYENFYNFLNDQDFLINLLVHSNKSLETLDVFYLRDDDIKKNDSNFIKTLTSNCKNLKTLRLRLLQNDELFMIFKCLKNLTHFNFFLSDQSDWSEKTFRASSELIPSTLKLLKIGIWQDLPSFDEFSLREFLNGCKKINLDRLEIYSFPKLNVHYVSILEDCGVNYKLIEAMDDW
nr:10642_t:CDS:2 [Entrophospora candida]